MPDTRHHRGPASQDARLFAPSQMPALRRAVEDFSLLLTRGYADKSALKLVGDRYRLAARQRLAVMRSACSDEQLESRRRRQIPASALARRPVLIDGFNLIITLESALGGAFLFVGRDGGIRDLASLHGTYRIVCQTPRAVELLGEAMGRFRPSDVRVLLDRPVSNSGRLRGLIQSSHPLWKVELHDNPDKILRQSPGPVITADSAVLDGCGAWVNLMEEIRPLILIPNLIKLC